MSFDDPNTEFTDQETADLKKAAKKAKSSSSLQTPLETYLREINETALLNADEEKMLARAIGQGDAQARDRMVRANLRLVVNIARGYTGKGLGLQDLIEEGNLGLLRAVEGFDPTMGTRFSTYASYWIKQSIKRALINSAKTIRIPAYMVELLSKWRRATVRLTDELRRARVEEIERLSQLRAVVLLGDHQSYRTLAGRSFDLRTVEEFVVLEDLLDVDLVPLHVFVQ